MGQRIIGVPWAYIKGNHCADRAAITEFGLAMNGSSLLIPSPLNKTLTDAVLNLPVIESGRVSLLAPMKGLQKIHLPDRRQLSFNFSWKNHEAQVVNVSGTLMVADLAVSDKVLPIAQWVKMYSSANCVQQLTDEEAHDVWYYDICRFNGWMPGTAPKCIAPKKTCGYVFRPIRKYESGYDPKTWGTFPFAMSASGFSMTSDMSQLLEEASDLDPVRELPFLRSTITQER